MSRDKVMDRVRKLLALASEEGGGTEGERNNALAKAQELMAKFQIEEFELAQAQGRESLPGIEMEVVAKLSLKDYWRYHLYYAIGEGVQVDALYAQRGMTKVVTLVGRPEAIEYVKTTVDWLVPQLELEQVKAAAELKESPEWGLAKRFRNSGEMAAIAIDHRRSFLEAAVFAVEHRLSMARRERGELGSALVLSDRAAKDEFYGDHKPVEQEAEVRPGVGSRDGHEAGSRVDLNPSNKVAAEAPRKELG